MKRQTNIEIKFDTLFLHRVFSWLLVNFSPLIIIEILPGQCAGDLFNVAWASLYNTQLKCADRKDGSPTYIL